MPDVLETLKKLPPSCIAEIGGKSVLITRGVMGYRHPELGTQFYLQPECTDEQRQAMIVGCTLGWHQLGADPDNQTEPEVVVRNQSKYTFMVPMVMEVQVVDYSLDQATAQVEQIVYSLVEKLQAYLDDERIELLCMDGEPQLLESTPL